MRDSIGQYKIPSICLLLVLIAITVYAPVYRFDFVNLDDYSYITENLHVVAGLTKEGIIWAFTSQHHVLWHPVTTLSHMLDCELFGLKPGGHHLTSVFFHILTALLLFGILKIMTGRIWPSAFAAAVFAVHPLNVESVAWISERKNVLSAFFSLLTIAAYIRYVQTQRFLNYVLVILVFSLALMSKPSAVTLPFVLLLLDYWPLRRFQWIEQNTGEAQPLKNSPAVGCNYDKSSTGQLLKEKIPLFILSIILCVVTVVAQKHVNALGLNEMIPFSVRLANALVSYVAYIGKMIYPVNLAAYYPHPGLTLPIWKPMVSLLALMIMSAGVLYAGRRKGYLITGWLMFLGTLVPNIGLVQAGDVSMADRFAYIPLIGLFIIIAWSISDLTAKWEHRNILLGGMALAVLSILAIDCRRQLSYWQDNRSLFEHALKVTKNNYMAHHFLAYSYYMQGRFDESIAQNYEALKIQPNALQCHNGIGLALLKQNKFTEAIDHFNRAIHTTSDSADARYNLGYVLFLQGKLPQAAVELARAVELNPESARTRTLWAQVLLAEGKTAEFVKQLKIVAAFSTDLAVLNNLAWCLAVYRDADFHDPAEAIRLAQAACRLNNEPNPSLLDTLAVAYAAAGQFEQAVATDKKALPLAQAANDKPTAASIQKHLALFSNHQLYAEAEPK